MRPEGHVRDSAPFRSRLAKLTREQQTFRKVVTEAFAPDLMSADRPFRVELPIKALASPYMFAHAEPTLEKVTVAGLLSEGLSDESSEPQRREVGGLS